MSQIWDKNAMMGDSCLLINTFAQMIMRAYMHMFISYIQECPANDIVLAPTKLDLGQWEILLLVGI